MMLLKTGGGDAFMLKIEIGEMYIDTRGVKWYVYFVRQYILRY